MLCVVVLVLFDPDKSAEPPIKNLFFSTIFDNIISDDFRVAIGSSLFAKSFLISIIILSKSNLKFSISFFNLLSLSLFLYFEPIFLHSVSI